MGQKKSKSAADIVNEVTPQVLIEHMQQCNAAVDQSQKVVNTGISLFRSTRQTATMSLNCVANFQVTADVIANIANRIQQEAATKGVALLDIGTNNVSEVNLKLRNIISPKITTSMVQQVGAKINQSQIDANAGIYIGGETVQSADVVVKALMDAVAKTGVAVEVENNSSQSAKSTSSGPLDFLANLGMMWIIFVLVFVVLLIGGLIYLLAD